MKINILVFLIVIIIQYGIPELYSQEYKVISGATLINTDGSAPIPNSLILIKDSIIISVGDKIKGKIPEGAEYIDAAGKYIIPGLIDAHIHFFQSGGLYTRPDGIDLRHRVPYKEQELKWIRDNIDDLFKRYISCGVTSVVDAGGPFWNFDIRNRADSVDLSPRVFCAGPLIASYQPEALTTEDPPIIKVNNIPEALSLVRKQAEMKTDFIKIWYIVSKSSASSLNEFYPIVKAIVDESHHLGLRVMVHATELETARKAVEAGCDILMHSVIDKEVDDEFLKLLKKNNVIYVPTLWVFNSYESVYSKQLKLLTSEFLYGNPYIIGTLFDMYELSYDELGERQKKLLVENKPIIPNAIALKNLKKVWDYGITIAAGTDAGNIGVIHGPAMFHDFELMYAAGLTNDDIIKSATINGAKLIGKEKQLGSIEKGKLADLVILNSNPLDKIQNTSDIYLVIKNGKAFVPDSILPKTAEVLAQIQLNAYNARDIEAFLSVYSEDVEVYEFPAQMKFKGIAQMRELYTNFFNGAPNLHCKLIDRLVQGNYVIDKERITGNPRKELIEASAIYETKDGLITKVWFIQ